MPYYVSVSHYSRRLFSQALIELPSPFKQFTDMACYLKTRSRKSVNRITEFGLCLAVVFKSRQFSCLVSVV